MRTSRTARRGIPPPKPCSSRSIGETGVHYYNDNAPVEIAGCPRMHAIQPFIVQSTRSRTYRYGDMAPDLQGRRRYLSRRNAKITSGRVGHPQLETMAGVAVTNRI